MRKGTISWQKIFLHVHMISHYNDHPHVPAKFDDASPLYSGVMSYFMQGLRVYTIVETAIFKRCGIFPCTLPYTTLEVKPVETAVFCGFSGYSLFQ